MCLVSSSFLRLGLLLGLACIVMQVLSILAGAWVIIREPLRTSPEDGAEDDTGLCVHTRIGLLRTCVRLERHNSSVYHAVHQPQPACTLPPLNFWREVVTSDLGISGHLEVTPQVITKLRQYSLLLLLITLALMTLGELIATVAYCKESFKRGIVISSYFFVFAGLVQCLCVTTVSTLVEVPHRVDTTMRVPAHKLVEPLCWETGLSYSLAVTVFLLAEIISALMLVAFAKRFSSMEAMVREIVPGAERKLREHQDVNLVGLWEIYPSRTARQLGCINLPGTATCYGKGSEPMAASKSKPDICSGNPDSLQQQGQPEGAEPAAAQDDQFDRGVSVSLGQPMSLTTSPAPAPVAVPVPAPGPSPAPGLEAQDASLAGVSVPITVMRGRPQQQQHRMVLDEMDTFPGYAGAGGTMMDGSMTVARRKGSAEAPAFSTMDTRRCSKGLVHAHTHGHAHAHAHAHAHTHTLPHPPRQF